MRHGAVCQVPFSEKENTSISWGLELSDPKERNQGCRRLTGTDWKSVRRCYCWLCPVSHAERRKTDAFELWCWRRLLSVPWTTRSNQSILKEISPGCSLEGLMLKLKLQLLATWCEELTHLKRPWCWERLKAGGKGDHRGWDGWMASHESE